MLDTSSVFTANSSTLFALAGFRSPPRTITDFERSFARSSPEVG